MNTLKYYADLCKEIYNEIPNVTYIDVNNFRIGYTKSTIIFQGTNDAKDWFTNFNILCVNGWHAGIFKAAQELDLIVYNLVTSLNITVMTGHSLGGALAIFFANKYNKKCISFNSPRIISKFTNKNVDGLLINIEGDLISKVPRIFFKLPSKIKRVELNYDGNPIEAHSIETVLGLLMVTDFIIKDIEK